MSERERLIELLQNVPTDFEGNRGVGAIADYLIEHNVIALPCKIGDTVYYVHKIPCEECHQVYDYRECSWTHCENRIYSKRFTLSMINKIGKTLFLTREEAEKVLREKNKRR